MFAVCKYVYLRLLLMHVLYVCVFSYVFVVYVCVRAGCLMSVANFVISVMDAYYICIGCVCF